ncbi:MAG: apolipoprotein N-acyltransferase [Luteolibacter sp.]
MPGRTFFLRLLAIVASGLMVASLVPPFSVATLAWLCLIPLLIALWTVKGRHRAKKGFLIGFLTGAIAITIQLSWLGSVSWLAVPALSLYLAIYYGIFGAFASTIGNPWHQKNGVSESPFRSLFTAFTHAAIFAGLEWWRGWFLTGFGWNGLGIAFHDTLVISQAADILGVTGLTLMLVFFQAVLVQVGHRLLKTGADGIKRPRWDFGATALCVGILLAYGILRVAGEGGKESITLKSLLIQINIPQDAANVLWPAEKVHMAYEDDTIAALEQLASADETALQQAIEKNDQTPVDLQSPDWVIWPETNLTGRMIRTDDGQWGLWRENIETISRVQQTGKFDLIYGTVEIEGETRDGQLLQKDHPRFYNSIAVHTADNEVQTFRKRHLVIFGETIPLIDSVPFLRKIYKQQSGVEYGGSFTPGPSLDPLPINLNGKEIQIIPSVCFEDTVPRLTRKFVRNAPQIIVNLTNDGWFKETSGAAQHFANARFRAIELRRPMLRCSNTGVTAALDTIGSLSNPLTGEPQIILDENGSSFTRDNLLATTRIPLIPSFSLYALIGDWGIIGLAIIGLIASIVLRKHKIEAPENHFQKRKNPSEQPRS